MRADKSDKGLPLTALLVSDCPASHLTYDNKEDRCVEDTMQETNIPSHESLHSPATTTTITNIPLQLQSGQASTKNPSTTKQTGMDWWGNMYNG